MENENKKKQIEEFNRIIKSNPEIEKAISELMMKILKEETAMELKRNPENEKAKSFMLAIELDELTDDICKICKGLTNLPDGEFKKHEQNLRLVQQTIKAEAKIIGQYIKEEEDE